MSDREVNPRHLQRALRVQNLTHSVTDSSYNLCRGTADANSAELLSLTHDECLLRVLKVRVLYIFLHRFYMRCAAAAARLDVYTLVSVCSTALLLAALAHAVLPRPRRRSTPAAVRHKPRSSSTPWSTRCTRTSSPATHRGVVIVYVLLRVVHALLLTFSVTSLVVQVIIIQVNGKGNK